MSDGADWTSTGRLFQSRGPAVANERSPTVTSRDGRTSRRLHWRSTSAAGLDVSTADQRCTEAIYVCVLCSLSSLQSVWWLQSIFFSCVHCLFVTHPLIVCNCCNCLLSCVTVYLCHCDISTLCLKKQFPP